MEACLQHDFQCVCVSGVGVGDQNVSLLISNTDVRGQDKDGICKYVNN